MGMVSPSSLPVRVGDLLAGKYRVERVLGAGGMGIVVAARHEELDQLVAIKFVRDEALDNEEGVQRFLREARAAVKLKSEHVARVLDVGKLESGAPYMVMEFLEGSDLGKLLDENGPVSLDCAADWILQACEAVAEAHASGIVHRDLKPENLFLTRSVGGGSKVKVLDFGVSKAVRGSSGELSGLTRTRAMLGSPLYMAPEQMRSSRDVNSSADVWALGVVLFQLLTDRFPFEADTMPELCLKVVTDAPMSLAALRPDVPADVVAVIERCLEKDPTRRFADAAELASALEPFVRPASRVLADRARLAMGTGPHSAYSMPGSTQLSGLPSPGGRPGANTPGTSAAWGAERSGESAVRPAKPRHAGMVVIGIIAAGVASAAALVFALQRPAGHAGSSLGAVPSASVAAASLVAPPHAADPVAPSAAPVEPPPASASATSVSPSPPVPASLAAMHVRREISVPPAKGPVPTPRAVPPPPVRDDDIPTIR
jgi:serine/threonine protein kinase